MRRLHQSAALVPLLWALASNGCADKPLAADGRCVIDSNVTVQCGDGLDGGSADAIGVVGYSCSGSARPDENAKYVEGVPEGLVCANRGAIGAEGAQGYCCTTDSTPCAYNPVAPCDSSTYGYQCRGASRPEAFNPTITCGQGVNQDAFIDYCCSGTPQPDGCLQSDAVGCSPRLLGWKCLGKNLPKGEELGASKSHADLYSFICAIPTPASNGYSNYCCYTPALVPTGGSCVEDTTVRGCAPGRFGFACYGPDTPQDDYLPIHCPAPGVPGNSAEGYPATFYCCDFQ